MTDTKPMNRLSFLKIKRKTLAYESQSIRKMELKWKDKARKAAERQKTELKEIADGTRVSLFLHRTLMVRTEARLSHLAQAFLRGIPYEVVEQKIWYRNFYGGFPTFLNKLSVLIYRFSDKTKPLSQIEKDVGHWIEQHPGYIEYILNQGNGENIKKYGDAWEHISGTRKEKKE